MTGNFTGTCRGREVAGNVVGRLAEPALPAGFTPAVPGEHPRLLFRRGDLPGLKKKLDSPLGKALVPLLTDAMGLALKYQLTGDRASADASAAEVRKLMSDMSDGHGHGRRAWAPRLEQVALAYDMCYDAWTPQFRTEVEAYFMRIARMIGGFERQWGGGGFSWAPLKHGGRAYVSMGFAALALKGEKSDAPAEPARPYADRPLVADIPPAEGYVPGDGVPLARYASDTMPGDWLYAGGFTRLPGQDPLAALGGPAALRPTVGTKVTAGARTELLRLLPHDPDKGYFKLPSGNAIDMTGATGRIYDSTSYFYCVVEMDAPRLVQVRTDFSPATVYLNGVARRPGDFALLRKGLYPFLVVTPIGETTPWGRITARPRLANATEAERDAHLAAQRTAWSDAIADWRADLAAWRASGGVNQDYERLFARARAECAFYLREALATGGYPLDVSYDGSTDAVLGRYITYHRNMLGYEPSPTHPVKDSVLRFFLEGKTGKVGGDPRGMGAAGPDIYPALFALVPAEQRATVVRKWHAAVGVTDAASLAKLLTSPSPGLTFVQYPLGLVP